MTKTLNTITKTELVEGIRAVIARRGPDYVYSQWVCSYGGPVEGMNQDRCIFGEVFIAELGIEYDPGWEGTAVWSLLGGSPNITKAEAREAYSIQARQDLGVEYGLLLEGLTELV